MTGLGLGLVGTFLHTALNEKPDPLAPYHYAQGLIRQLIDISGGLDNGLDPVALGGAILSAVRDDLPTSALVISVPRGDTLTPLVTKAMGASVNINECEDIAVEAWAVGLPVLHDHVFAFPLNTEAGTTAIVAGVLSARVDPARIGVEDRIRKLMRRLGPSAVHLDTALLFSAFRDAATAEERRRLSREMHDGVAQDIASLGYLVDTLRVGVTSPEQAERIDMLRDRISAVVAEIRRSVVNLRTSVGQSESLGTAIGSIARNLSEVSGVPIHVTLDEHTQRLRPEVEAELFRIAQEAMNNAVRHAQASAIDVHCDVHAPEAVITVSDNGRGPPDGPVHLARPAHHEGAGAAHQRHARDRRDRIRGPLGHRPTSRKPRVRVPCPGRHPRKGHRMTATPTTVLLVDDHELIRSGLAGVFDLEEDMTIVAQAGSVVEALKKYDELRPDVVVADLQLQDGTGLDIVRSIRKVSNTTGLVVLTMHSGDDQIFAAMQAGASGFVGKDAPSGEVIRAARHAAVSPRSFVCTGLVGAMMRRSAAESTRLSDREHEVLLLLADGLGAAAIGEKLYLSESTAKSHIARIYQKLGASNRAQALVTAMRIGLLSSVRPVDT